MNQNREEKKREILSMEEYLKRRQAVRSREAAQCAAREEESVRFLLETAFYL